jgi:hypothetical protein
VAYERGFLDVVVLDEELKIFCYCGIVVLGMMRGIAMVAGVDSVDWSLQVANEHPALKSVWMS